MHILSTDHTSNPSGADVTSPWSFDGRVAVVSGASHGMGEATARRLAADGARLVLMAAPSDREALEALRDDLRTGGHEVRTSAGDIADRETSEAAVAEAMNGFGRLDYVVNNAGIYPERPLLEETADFYDRIFSVNVVGLKHLCSAATAVMTSPGGAITCTASTCSLRAIERYAAYNISKGAVLQFCRALAVQLAPRGIRVNAVAPGVISAGATDEWTKDPNVWSKQRSRIPLDRIGRPKEVAAVTAFLLSDRASYIAGATVMVDGGESAGWRDSDWLAVPHQDLAPRLRTPGAAPVPGAGLLMESTR
jgi:meso-butanediol dehydrogenase/(S,S)-butanediol dehydrogenase/diacetyl reductase